MTWIIILTSHRKWYKKESATFFYFTRLPKMPLTMVIVWQDEKADANIIISSILIFDVFALLLVFTHKIFLLESSMDRNHDLLSSDDMVLWLLSLSIIILYGYWLCYCVHNNFDLPRGRSLRPGIGYWAQSEEKIVDGVGDHYVTQL